MSTINLTTITEIKSSGSKTDQQTSFPFADFEENYSGRPISLPFAKNLVDASGWKTLNESKTTAVTFSSRVILLLLSQKDCTGIRCYFAKLKNNTETLVIIGIDSEGNDLGVTSTIKGAAKYASMITQVSNEEQSLIVEVGGTCNLSIRGLDLNNNIEGNWS